MQIYEVWSLDRYESTKIRAQTRSEAAERYDGPVTGNIYVAADKAIYQFSADGSYEIYKDWR